MNQHKFTIGLADSPQCDCHYREESPSHYFLDCFLYTHERQALLGLIEHYIPKFTTFTKSKKLDIILNGFDGSIITWYMYLYLMSARTISFTIRLEYSQIISRVCNYLVSKLETKVFETNYISTFQMILNNI